MIPGVLEWKESLQGGRKMYRYLLFDLDGTLTDSSEGICKSIQYSLGKIGIQEDDLKKLEVFS